MRTILDTLFPSQLFSLMFRQYCTAKWLKIFSCEMLLPTPHPPTLSQCEFRVFTRLTGEPFPDARAALPSLFSSIIYCAQARKCTELRTHQFLTFCSHTDLSQFLTILSAVAPHDLGVSTAPDPSHCSTNLCASLGCRSAGVMRVPVAVRSSWSRYGWRSLGWHRQAWHHRLHQPHPPLPLPPLATLQVRLSTSVLIRTDSGSLIDTFTSNFYWLQFPFIVNVNNKTRLQ